jgi:hypothetical protein
VKIGSINPNLFQDQCYKYGSFGNPDPKIRERAVGHVLDSIELAGDSIEIGRTYRLFEWNEIVTIRAAQPGAPWDDPANLVSITGKDFGPVEPLSAAITR